MARRVALIPEELVSSYHLQKPEIRVEDDIVNLLEQGKLTDDMKVKLLSQLITRYHKIVNEPPEPVRVSFAENGGERKGSRDKQEGEEKFEAKRKAEEITDPILNDILVSVPKSFSKFVPLLIEKLKAHEYFWNDDGEMTKKNVPYKNVRIVDFFLYIFRNVRAQPPLHEFQIYLDVIREINIPRGWIGNKGLLKILTFDDGTEAAASSFSSTPGEDRRGRHRSADRVRRRRRSESPGSQSIYETPIKWGAKTLQPKEWKTY